jgi:hypothetical protein
MSTKLSAPASTANSGSVERIRHLAEPARVRQIAEMLQRNNRLNEFTTLRCHPHHRRPPRTELRGPPQTQHFARLSHTSFIRLPGSRPGGIA